MESVRRAFTRLPTAIKPIHYSIRLKPDLKAFTFKGWMNVDLEVVSDTRQIVCNAAEIKVDSLKLESTNLANFKICEDTETLTVDLPDVLKAGNKATLFCSYTGILNDKMRGFYRSKYTTETGEDRYSATTQFEATDARRCFPCWDEPAVKATFSISVIAPKDRTVHSNMPEDTNASDAALDTITNSEMNSDLKLVSFQKSPIMSTYLVAIVVGEFEAIAGETSKTKSKGVKVSAWTPLGKTEQGRFALETSIRALEYYTDFFDVPYPLPKYDCIAIADFECGAMENWGLVTYRESCILVDPKNTSSGTKQWVAIVVNHEMAHQWFGNLVTMEWWTHLWLNEGFASFMENNCTGALFPEFDIWTQFVSNTLIAALELDALENSHPIEVKVGHPSEVDEIFDNISYNKGASVIRMLYNFIGQDPFRKGMKHYLEKFSYQNAETEDLWSCLESASGKPVQQIMSTWTSQMGFPLITVEKVQRIGDETVIDISQKKFNADGSDTGIEKYHWNIPIDVITKSDPEKVQSFLMTDQRMQLKVPTKSDSDWVKLNDNFIGYYRVKYPAEQLLQFTPDIASKALNELNRLNILDDLMAQVQAGLASADLVLKLLKSFISEDSFVVWSCIDNCLNNMRVIIADEPCYPHFNNFIKYIMSEIIDQIGWKPKENEHHTKVLLRMLVISKMGILGHEATVKEAKRRFQRLLDGTEEIPADLRSPVYRIVAANGGNDVFDQMLALYRKNQLSEEKDRIARAMGYFSDVEILKKVLQFGISPDVRSQDSPFVIVSVADNPKGRDIAWSFYQNNFDLFMERYKGGGLMSRMIKATCGSFATEDRAVEVEKFFQARNNPAERAVKQSIEAIRLNAAWLKRDGEKIANFLEAEKF